MDNPRRGSKGQDRIRSSVLSDVRWTKMMCAERRSHHEIVTLLKNPRQPAAVAPAAKAAQQVTTGYVLLRGSSDAG